MVECRPWLNPNVRLAMLPNHAKRPLPCLNTSSCRRKSPFTPTDRTLLRWRRWQFQPCVLRHHPLKPDPHASDCEGATCEETGDDGVPGVFFAPYALNGAVEGAEHAAPDAEVASNTGARALTAVIAGVGSWC